MFSALNKDDLNANTLGTLKQDDEDRDAIKADPIFGEEGCVQVPKTV